MPIFTFGRKGSIKINITTQLRLKLNEFSLVGFKATSPEPFASPVEKKEFLSRAFCLNRGPYFFFSNMECASNQMTLLPKNTTKY